MKKTFLYLAAALLLGAGSLAASCSKDEAENHPSTDPTFPAAVAPTVMAGEHYTLSIETDRDWEVSIPSTGEAAKWFWIEDGSLEVRKLRGEAGKASIVIATLAEENYSAAPACEVTLTMKDSRGNDASKVIATITIGKIERSLAVYACELDEYGDFALDPDSEESGLSYLYKTAPTTELRLVWPEGRGSFSLPIMVDANFDWSIRGEVPAWLSDMTVSGGTGGKTELRLTGDKLNYPLEESTATINFGTEETTFPVKITIPGSKDIFISDFAKESKFNYAGEVYNSASSSYTPGTAHGEITATEGLVLYVFSEKDQWGSISLSDDPQDIAWMNITLADWQKGEGVVQNRRLEVGVGENPGDARKGYILGLPAGIAAQIGESWELTDRDAIRPEYEKYIITAVLQEYNPGPISASADKDVLAGVGTQFSKYASTDWQYNMLQGEFGTTFIYNLTYSTGWGDEDWNLVFGKPYSSFKRFEWHIDNDSFTELTDNDADWLTYDDRWKKIRMDEQDEVREGVVVFYDQSGEAIGAIHCVYDKNATPGGDEEGFKVEFIYPDYAPMYGASLELIEEGSVLYWAYYEWISEGIPVYHLTYTAENSAMMAQIRTSSYGNIMIMPIPSGDDNNWVDYEIQNEDGTEMTISMDKAEQGQSNMDDYGNAFIQFFDNSYNMKAVIVCTADY